VLLEAQRSADFKEYADTLHQSRLRRIHAKIPSLPS
jgi:hypothetical protein